MSHQIVTLDDQSIRFNSFYLRSDFEILFQKVPVYFFKELHKMLAKMEFDFYIRIFQINFCLFRQCVCKFEQTWSTSFTIQPVTT